MLSYSIKNAALATNLSTRTLRKHLYEIGDLVGRRVGARVVIEHTELERWLAAQPRATSAAVMVSTSGQEVPHGNDP